MRDRPEDVLSAWTALEVLSPVTYRKPADMADGDTRRIAALDGGLPWRPPGEKAAIGGFSGTAARVAQLTVGAASTVTGLTQLSQLPHSALLGTSKYSDKIFHRQDPDCA